MPEDGRSEDDDRREFGEAEFGEAGFKDASRRSEASSGPLASLNSFQENLRRSGPVASAGYTLIGAILLLGGIGYALDAWRGTSPGFLLAGLLFGIIVGFYELAKIAFGRKS